MAIGSPPSSLADGGVPSPEGEEQGADVQQSRACRPVCVDVSENSCPFQNEQRRADERDQDGVGIDVLLE